MLSSKNNCFNSVTLWNLNEVTATTFLEHFANFAVESPMGQRLLLAGIYFDYDAGAVLVLVEELG